MKIPVFSAILPQPYDPASPEKQLIFAMIERAYLDICLLSTLDDDDITWRSKKKLWARTAYDWFCRKPWVTEPEVFTFQWCLMNISTRKNIEGLFGRIQRLIRKRYFAH